MFYLVAIVLAISAMLGLSTPANASEPVAPASITEALQIPNPPVGGVDVGVRCEEDMPCWDCATMGNLQCGPVAHEADAYLAFDALGGVPVSEELMLSYVSSFTTDVPELKAGQFILHSTQTDGLNHVMQWDTLSHC